MGQILDFPEMELLPADDDDLSPDAEAAAAVDPTDIPLLDDEPDDLTPVGISWYLNPDTGQYDSTPLPVEGVDSVVQVLYMALLVPRGVHPMIPDDLGMENPTRLYGRVDTPELRADYQRDIRDTFMSAHDHVLEVRDFLFIHNEDSELVMFDATIELQGMGEVRVEGLPLV